MAIHELRRKFAVSLWDEEVAPPGQIEQVWFSGVHCDVGGWYPERGLSDTALIWQLEHAEAEGLRLREGWRDVLAPDHLEDAHESYGSFWRAWPRTPRVIPEGAKIHDSVRIRMEQRGEKVPLPERYTFVDQGFDTRRPGRPPQDRAA